MSNKTDEKLYVGFYTDKKNVEKLNVIAGAMYQNNRSCYLNECLKRCLDKDYKQALNRLEENSLERSQNE